MQTKAYAAETATSPLAPSTIERRQTGPKDVALDIMYCGVCHSDLHASRGEWANMHFPCVPGHEIVGRVTGVGGEVTKFSVGQLVGVGCMVDSCRTCASCEADLEQYCLSEHGAIQTYNGGMKGGTPNTFGGYSASIVVDEHFVLSIAHPEDQLAAVAPLLCAGITTYAPLKHWGAGPGTKIGIVGIGGLGHMGLKIAKAMGAHVVAFTTSPKKREEALQLGADEVVNSTNPEEMKAHETSIDFILNTVAAPHNLDAFTALLKIDGTLTVVGAPAENHPAPSVLPLIFGRRAIAGSVIGGLKETQEMLDFCAEHDIVANIEMVKMSEINEAFERMLKADVRYRFVIDMASI